MMKNSLRSKSAKGVTDLRRFSEAALLIHSTRNAGDFSSNILAAMRQVLAVDICVVDWYGFQGLPVRTIYDPMDAVPRQVNEALHQFAHQSPIYGNCQAEVRAVSDLVSRAAWHRTDLYQEGFRQVEQEDCIILDVDMRKDCRLSLFSSRSRRGFSMEERAVLAMLGPHVQQVFDRLDAQGKLEKSLEAQANGIGIDDRLSARECEVLQWLAQGKSNSEIALLLDIRPATVKKHLANLYAKLGVENRHAAALLVLRPGITE
jgi:DNA-binding CsgD family transcriptional regulator